MFSRPISLSGILRSTRLSGRNRLQRRASAALTAVRKAALRLSLCLPFLLFVYLLWYAGVEPVLSPDEARGFHNCPPNSFRDNGTVIPSLNASDIDTLCLVGRTNCTPFAVSLPYTDKWKAHPHLIVIGIMSTGHDERVEMRRAQRMSWGSFPEVARKDNGFEGQVLLMMLQSLSSTMHPYVNPAVYEEILAYEDSLLLHLLTPPQTQKRKAGEGGTYGLAFQVMNSRKLLLYYRYVYTHFPSTPFIGKTDDDSFLYIPELLRMTRQLPRQSTGYGCLNKNHLEIKALWGHYSMLTRDVAIEVAGDDPKVVRLTAQPFSPCSSYRYQAYRFDAEDNIHHFVLKSLYGKKGIVGARRRPEPPLLSPGVPPVEGWGKAYMALLDNHLTAPRADHALGSNALYNVSFAFLSVDEPFQPSNVVLVADNCRVRDTPPSAENGLGTIAQHRVLTASMHKDLMTVFDKLERDNDILRPKVIKLLQDDELDFQYLVRMEDACRNEQVRRRSFNWPRRARRWYEILYGILRAESAKRLRIPSSFFLYLVLLCIVTALVYRLRRFSSSWFSSVVSLRGNG